MARKSFAKWLSVCSISNSNFVPKTSTAWVREYVLTRSSAAESESNDVLCDGWSWAEFELLESEVESFRGYFCGRGDGSSTLFLFTRARWGALALALNNKGASARDRFKIPALTMSASYLGQTE